MAAPSHGSMGFNALQRTLPRVSRQILSVTLRGLERDGLVKRKGIVIDVGNEQLGPVGADSS